MRARPADEPGRAAWIQRHRREVLICLLLAATVWVARYWHYDSFGFYEDDYFRAAPAIDLPASEVLQIALERSRDFRANNGRPIHEVGVFTGALLGYKLGGLAGIYRLGWMILAVNAILCYFLLRQLSGSEAFAVAGALLFATFPSDTTPAYLTSTFGTQPALTFLMVAILCFAAGWRVTAYLVAAGALLTYETAFPAFLAAPLFERPWRRPLWRRLLVHGGIVTGMLLVTVAIRKLGGEARLSETSVVEMARAALEQMAAGPWWALWLALERPLQELRPQLSLHPLLLMTCFAAFVAVLAWLPRPTLAKEAPRLLFTGALVLVLAYPLTLTAVAWATEGRETRVHMVAAIGAAILAAAVGSLLLGAFQRVGARILMSVPIGVLLTCSVASCIRVQHDFVLAWEYQRAFWTDFVRLCPDLDEQTMILVDRGGFRRAREATALGWQVMVQLPLMFRYPGDWSEPPRGFLLSPDWRERAERGQDILHWIELRGFGPEILSGYQNPEYIWLESRDGMLHRRTGRIEAGGFTLDLKPLNSSAPSYPQRKITDHLLLGEGALPVAYIDP